MKLLFVCSGYEPGMDGVGDYVRRLAESLDTQGHTTAILALNDKAVAQPMQADLPRASLQLPATLDWPLRIARARAFVREFAPDWVSLQFACYQWAYQGLPILLPGRLRSILPTHSGMHLMFHELCVGLGTDAPLRHRLLGALQRELVIRPLARLPQVVHTNIHVYAEILARWGTASEVLPLFGNIPVVAVDDDTQAAWWRRHVDLPREGFYVAGIFGSLKVHALNAPFMQALMRRAEAEGRRLLVAAAGHLTDPGERYFDACGAQYRGQAEFRRLGRLPAEDVSRYLSSLDLGIASTPWPYLGKSGSVAAMLEHGLPVVVGLDDQVIRGLRCSELQDDPRIMRFSDAAFEQRLAQAKRGGAARDERAAIAARLVQALGARSMTPGRTAP